MQAILTGIYGLFSAGGDLKTALTGGLHIEIATPGIATPYAVYSVIAGRPEYLLGGEQTEIITIQFDIYAESNSSRQTLYGYLTALYDDARPTISGYTSIVMERTFQQLLRAGDDHDFYRAIVEYQLTVEKN